MLLIEKGLQPVSISFQDKLFIAQCFNFYSFLVFFSFFFRIFSVQVLRFIRIHIINGSVSERSGILISR